MLRAANTKQHTRHWTPVCLKLSVLSELFQPVLKLFISKTFTRISYRLPGSIVLPPQN